MGGNFFSLFWMMSDNLAKLGHFNAAHDICTSLLAQGRDYMDEGTRTAFETNAVLFGLQSQWPRMGISDADTNYDIPFDVEDEQIKFTVVRGTQRISAMLDSGGQMTVIDKQLTERLGLPLSADSIWFNPAIGRGRVRQYSVCGLAPRRDGSYGLQPYSRKRCVATLS